MATTQEPKESDAQTCSECSSKNAFIPSDAPDGVVECADCRVQDYPASNDRQ